MPHLCRILLLPLLLLALLGGGRPLGRRHAAPLGVVGRGGKGGVARLEVPLQGLQLRDAVVGAQLAGLVREEADGALALDAEAAE